MKKSILMILAMAMSTLSSAYTPRGFGIDMGIKDSLQIIVPKDWGISISKSLVNKKVNWTGGDEWRNILRDISEANNITVNYDERNKAVEIVSKESSMERVTLLDNSPARKDIAKISKKKFIYGKVPNKAPIAKPQVKAKVKAKVKVKPRISEGDLSEMRMLAKGIKVNNNKSPKTKSEVGPQEKSIFHKIKSEIGSLFSTKKESPVEKKETKKNEISIQDDTKLNYAKITVPKKENIQTKLPEKKEKSFLSSLSSEIGSILTYNKEEKEERKLTTDEQSLKSLFQSMGYMIVDIYGYKSISLRDNTVKFTYKLTTPEKEIDSFIVFDGQSMYAPMIKEENRLIILDWYSSNYKHPAAVIMEPVRPLSKSYIGEVSRDIKKKMPDKVYFLKDPSYLEKRRYTIKEGTMLSKAIQDWATVVGIEVVWKSRSDFKITKELSFYDGFLQSVEKVIGFYNATKAPFQTRFFVKNKVLLVESIDIIYRNGK